MDVSPTPHTYGQYCPISRALDVLGERWTLMIVREMIVGSTRFNEIARGLPGLSRTLLSKRLRVLQAAGIVERNGSDYGLTPAGAELEPVVMGLAGWGASWAFDDPRPEELDSELLMWWIHGRLDTSVWPGRRHIMHFRFTDDPRRYWVVVEDAAPSLCHSDPGFDVDVSVTSDVATLYRVWNGRIPLSAAVRNGTISFDGSTSRTRQMSAVFQLSPIAPIVGAISR